MEISHRQLDVAHRRPDRRRAIHRDRQRDGRRQRGPQLRQQRLDAVDRVDDVGARLTVDDEEDRRLAVGEAGVADVLDRVLDVGHVGQVQRRAVDVREHDRPIVLRLEQLIARRQAPGPPAVGQLAFRLVRIGRGELLGGRRPD